MPLAGLHVWRPNSGPGEFLDPVDPAVEGDRWTRFRCRLDHQATGPVNFLLFGRSGPGDATPTFESNAHCRNMPRDQAGRFRDQVYFVQGASRVLDHDPTELSGRESVRIHLITGSRYQRGKLYVWDPGSLDGERYEATGEDELGPFFDVALAGDRRNWFLFKFIRPNGDFEPEQANRLWSSRDGGEVWTVAEAPHLSSTLPSQERLVVHFRQEIAPEHVPMMHVWKDHSSYVEDVEGMLDSDGWHRHEVMLWTGFPYLLQFWNPTLPEHRRWEHPECVREVCLAGPDERWTLEGDAHWFGQKPVPDRRVIAEVVASPPSCPLHEPAAAGVWVNRARGWLHSHVDAIRNGTVQLEFTTYPDVPTSLRLEGEGMVEELDRHVVTIPGSVELLKCYLVVEREGTLREAPPHDLFADPPFAITRPGVSRVGGTMRFVVSAPQASRVRLVTSEDHGLPSTIDMRSTTDGRFWWAEVATTQASMSSMEDQSDPKWRYRIILDEEPAREALPV